jgi:Uma2 family endonuclease
MNVLPQPTTLTLCFELAGARLTPEEFDAAEESDDQYRYELIHGVLVVTPIPAESEADPNEELGYLLRAYRDQHAQGAALDRTLPERLVRTPAGRRRADRVIWAGLGRVPDPVNDPPTIVVEFVSRARRDRLRDYVAKREEYLALGVAEYWIIDRFRRQLTVVVSDPAGPREQIVAEGEVYATPRLPGFELPLARLLRCGDDWGGPR